MDKLSKSIRILFFIAIGSPILSTVIFAGADAQAQEYTQIAPFSKFHCAYISDSKSQIAIESPPGRFKKISFKSAKDANAKKKDELRKKQKKAAQLKNTLLRKRSQFEFIRDLTQNEYNQLVAIFTGAVVPGDQIESTVSRLEQIISSLQAEIEFQNLERTLITDCEKNKLPPLSSLPVSYEVLIAQDLSNKEWYGDSYVYVKAPAAMFPGVNTAACLKFASGLVLMRGFTRDPFGAHDSLLSFASNHPLVIHGETARPLEIDSNGKVTKVGTVISGILETSSFTSRETVEARLKSAIPAAMAKYGTVVQAERPKYNKQLKKSVCPTFGNVGLP